MGLNIKTDEAHRLARELATLTGESMTTAVVVALRERLERLQRAQRRVGLAERLMAISRDCAERLKDNPLRASEIDDLYDEETGLPK